MEEIWKDIYYYNIPTEEWIDYRGLYQISNLGRVKSVERYEIRKNGAPLFVAETIRRVSYDGNNYPQVVLYKDGLRQSIKIHRLVANMFIPNPEGYTEVNHKDENKSNNCVDNLEWCDTQYNVNWGTGQKRRAETVRKDIIVFDLEGNQVAEYHGIDRAAKELGAHRQSITNVLIGKKPSLYGYTFKYKT